MPREEFLKGCYDKIAALAAKGKITFKELKTCANCTLYTHIHTYIYNLIVAKFEVHPVYHPCLWSTAQPAIYVW